MRGTEKAFQETLDAARLGVESAWAEIYHEYSPKVLGYLRARGTPDPEDLLGEVLFQVVRDLHRFSGGEPEFRSWIFTVAHNRMLDAARARSRRPKISQNADVLAIDLEPTGNVEDEAIDSLRNQQIREMLDRLSDDQQTVLLLRLFAGMTTPQIAALMGKTAGAVKALQHRGLTTLRAALERESVLLESDGALQGERA